MKIKTRILLGFLVICITGLFFLVDFIVNEIRPRYLETVEESLNDTANILATLVETEVSHKKINTDSLEKVFNKVILRKFSAQIYGVKKTNVNVHVYVTNKKGIVIYDSRNGKNIGKDYSKWNDVYLTLRGQYGARSSLTDKNDPSTSTIYLAAPIKYQNEIVGVITAIKPKESVTLFIELATRKVVVAGILTMIVFIFFSLLLSTWINTPIKSLMSYVKLLRTNKNAKLPYLSSSEIKELGQAFEELKNELEGKKYIEHYIQTMTHELKSPLSSIRGAAELLNEEMSENQKKVFYNNILNESERIEKIIQKLLELSSLENRTGLKNIEKININELISNLKKSLAPQLIKKKININYNIAENEYIFGEKFLIRHAINNILDNSIKFSNVNSNIEIFAKKNKSFLELSFVDSGDGIPEYAIDKVFNKFYSLPTKNQKSKSSGLGLVFVQEVIDLHNGSVEVKNNETAGVAVKMLLPLQVEQIINR